MYLKLHTSLGLRTLLYLGANRHELTTVSVLIEELNCSRHHLQKVMIFLRKQGWVTSIRGRFGGFSIPDQVLSMKMGDLVRVLEGDESLVKCLEASCPLKDENCPFTDPMDKALDVFYSTFNKYSLMDLVGNREKMIAFFNQVSEQKGN